MGIFSKRKAEDEGLNTLAAPLSGLAAAPRSERSQPPRPELIADAPPRLDAALKPDTAPKLIAVAASATAALAAGRERRSVSERTGRAAQLGKSIHIKGDIAGDEDLVIEGRVEGRVELADHQLTIGPSGEVIGEVRAREVSVLGRVVGNVVASERVEVADGGRVHGDIESPRLSLQEGSQLNGKVDMRPTQAVASGAGRKLEKSESDRSKSAPSALPSPANATAQAALQSF